MRAGGENMLFQFSCNAAALNLDLRLWMTALRDFTLPGGLVVGPRFFDKAPVLQDDIFSTPPWNHFTTRGLQSFCMSEHSTLHCVPRFFDRTPCRLMPTKTLSSVLCGTRSKKRPQRLGALSWSGVIRSQKAKVLPIC